MSRPSIEQAYHEVRFFSHGKSILKVRAEGRVGRNFLRPRGIIYICIHLFQDRAVETVQIIQTGSVNHGQEKDTVREMQIS